MLSIGSDNKGLSIKYVTLFDDFWLPLPCHKLSQILDPLKVCHTSEQKVNKQIYKKMHNFMTEMNIKVKLQVILVGIDILKIIFKIWHYHSRDVTSDVMKICHIFFWNGSISPPVNKNAISSPY